MVITTTTYYVFDTIQGNGDDRFRFINDSGCASPQGEFYTSPGISTERMYAFIATDLTPVGQRLEAGERIRVETVTLDRARSMLNEGELVDGKTIAVLATYLLNVPHTPTQADESKIGQAAERVD